MNFAILFVAAIAASYATPDDDMLEITLQSPAKLQAAFAKYVKQQHKDIPAADMRKRLGIFRENVQRVVAFNADPDNGSKFTVYNQFGDMSEEEKLKHTGLKNMTSEAQPEVEASLEKREDVPDSKMWLEATAPVVDQGDCGSCWAFGALGAAESRYQIVTGVFRDFSEQELVDCTYSEYNGCYGGWMHEGWEWLRDQNKGKITSVNDYTYIGYDSTCRSDEYSDVAVAAKIDTYGKVMDEQSTIAKIGSSGGVTVTVYADDMLFAYETGILTDTDCDDGNDWLNHAMTAVGYTPQYLLVKNSWGTWWGDRGFVKYSRGHKNCHLYITNYFVDMVATGVEDTRESDPTTDYKPEDSPNPNPVPCEDEARGCFPLICPLPNMSKYCNNMCEKCDGGDDGGDDGGECPNGTVRCADGTCKHVHMC